MAERTTVSAGRRRRSPIAPRNEQVNAVVDEVFVVPQ